MSDAPATLLWDELKEILRLIAQIWGEPARLFEDVVLPTREGLRLRTWLAALERLARTLLLVMAARLPKPAPARARTRTSGRPSAPEQREAEGLAFPPEVPGSELWAGVVFHALPCEPGRDRARERRAWSPPRRFMPARALAYRFEALIRIAEAPEPFARRLARRLWAEPALAERVLDRGGGRADEQPPWDDLVVEGLSSARMAAVVFFTDSG
jgi:hypothetical protein